MFSAYKGFICQFYLCLTLSSCYNAQTMKNHLLILLTACCLISALSCKKKVYDPVAPPLLPEISSDGRNSFGLMFGNEVWVKGFSLYPTLTANYGSPFGSPVRFYLSCSRSSTRTKVFDNFTLEYFNLNITPGTYPIDNLTAKVVVDVSYPGDKTREYGLDVGTITFSRWDLVNRVASGTFSMTLKDVASGEKVSITQGRFDVKLSS